MAIPTLITELSTTALSNAPSGEDAPSTLDNIQRAHASFIAKLRDESQTLASKDASSGYAGLTLFKLNLKNAANTFTNFFTNATTAARTWTLPDKDGTVAMTADITGGTSAGSFTTLSAGATTLTSTSAGVTTYPHTVQNVEDATAGTGVGHYFRAHTSAVTGAIASVRDSAGNYSLRLSAFINGAALTEGLRLSGTGGVTIPGTLGVTGVITATAGVTHGTFTVATRPAHAAGKTIYVSDGGAGAVFQGSTGAAWVNLG